MNVAMGPMVVGFKGSRRLCPACLSRSTPAPTPPPAAAVALATTSGAQPSQCASSLVRSNWQQIMSLTQTNVVVQFNVSTSNAPVQFFRAYQSP